MPIKDPSTGCNVLTLAEFFNSEAKHEGQGRTGADVAKEYYDELVEEEKKQAQHLSDPKFALDVINSYIKENNESFDLVKYPEDKEFILDYTLTEVLRVWDVVVDIGMSSSEEFSVEAICSDGKIRKLKYRSWNSPGSYVNPPEGETFLEEIV